MPYVWLLVVISLSLNLYGINWGLPNEGQDWANDSIAPLGPLVYAKHLIFQELWWSKYPPFHYMVLALFYAPYTLYLVLTGGLASPTDIYPYGLKDPEFSLMVFTLIARVTSAVMGTGTVLVNYYTAKTLYGHRAGLISALLIASSYAIIYYSHTANIDVPQLFWISLALYSFVSLLKTYETKYYVLLGLFTALAIGTKNSAYALFLGLALSLLWSHIRHERATTGSGAFLSALVDRKLLYGFGALVVALILVFNLPFNWEGFVHHVQFHMGRSVKGSWVIRESASVFQGDLKLMAKYLIHILQANGLPAFLLLVGGYFYCLFKYPAKVWTFLLPMVTYYVIFLRMHGTDHIRYILPIHLMLSWTAGKFAADLLDYRKVSRLISLAAILFILAHSLAYGLSLDFLITRDSRYSAEKWMEENIPQGALVAAHDPGYSLPRFPAGMRVRHIDSRRGRINGDVGSVGADYLVLGMSLPGRVNGRLNIYQWLHDRGFRPVASFKSAAPTFGAELFHAVNPEIVIFEQVHNPGNRQKIRGSLESNGGSH